MSEVIENRFRNLTSRLEGTHGFSEGEITSILNEIDTIKVVESKVKERKDGNWSSTQRSV